MSAHTPTVRSVRRFWMPAFCLACLCWLAGTIPSCSPEPTPAPKHTPPAVGRQMAGGGADALYAEGVERAKNRDMAGAADAFDRALEADPAHYQANLGLGEIHLRQRQYAQARTYFERAAAADGTRLEARFQLARAHRAERRPDRARALLAELSRDFPNHLPTRLLLADLLMTAAPPDPLGARDQYRAVLSRQPGHPQARAGAAASALRLGLFAQAADALERLSAEHPDDPHLSFLLGTAWHRLGEYAAAIDAYRRAVDALPPGAPQRRVRLWNLHLAWRAAGRDYPGDLEPRYRLDLPALDDAAPVRFHDAAPALGLDRLDRGRGVAWGDFDSDGDEDLFAVGIQTPHGLYRNDGGEAFADITARAGLADGRGGWAAPAADYDNDGDLDIYVTRDAWEGRAPNSLYTNEDGIFTDTASQAGVAGNGDSFTAAWGDLDNDGRIDLYVAQGITGSGAANSLYRNNGDGAFTDIAARAGVGHTGKSLGVALGDPDNDGDLDIYIADVAGPNTLYRNDGETFTDITAPAGVERPTNGGYVTFFFDGDGDGHTDLFVSGMSYYEHFVEARLSLSPVNASRAHLYRNDANGAFTDIAPGSGLARNFGSMGAAFADVDYDGRIDLYLCNGGPVMTRFEPNTLFHNREDGFVDVTDQAGVGTLGKGHGAAFADYDADGDLDLYAAVGGHYPGDAQANSLYRNEGTSNHWLGVALEGRSSNRSAVGARLSLYRNGQQQTAEVSSGVGFGSHNSFQVEFGLGTDTAADSLVIRWPAGGIQRLDTVVADRILYLREGESP